MHEEQPLPPVPLGCMQGTLADVCCDFVRPSSRPALSRGIVAARGKVVTAKKASEMTCTSQIPRATAQGVYTCFSYASSAARAWRALNRPSAGP